MEDFGKAIKMGSTLIGRLLEEHAEAIERAYLKTDEAESYSVTLGLKFKDAGGNVDVECNISFVESKVKDSAKATVTPQMEIPLE